MAVSGSSPINEQVAQPSPDKYIRILDAALELFAQKGFYETKIAEIAKRAHVGDGTVYLYFASKEDLLVSLFETHLDAINHGIQQRLSDTMPAREALELLIDYHFFLAQNNPNLAIFITTELKRSAQFIRQYAKTQFSDYLAQWQNVLERGQADGTFRCDFQASIVKHLFFGALDHLCNIWVHKPDRDLNTLEHSKQEATNLLLHAVLAPTSQENPH